MENKTKELPILIELDEETRSEQLNRAAAWFNNVLLTQTSFRQLLEDTVPKIKEPHIKEYLAELAVKAKEHEEKIHELFTIIGREPSDIRTTLGSVMGKARQALGDFIAATGSAKGPWQDLHQLYLSNYNSMGALSVAEQLGLALGIPSIVDIAFVLVSEKSTAQLLLQESVLEMCSMSILYHERF
ncbi:hypothetical protein CLV24_14124 [Pontibacter ummariensis]|uniref:Ferritin-like metal-binding protein YciE n=1 Tax=Pontibacter ummariensis TaxID=1610492 RepID=A0A239LGY3_9BACT|nr:hypothetical protein [Pontibacter ummariensis]PRY03392.1 hypothetical protein CLV24_14124 [Pontibacter ummariensis]SNT29093.1 hypothetical protein SAMN06296052_1412 [Pontibacter ummariensis]